MEVCNSFSTAESAFSASPRSGRASLAGRGAVESVWRRTRKNDRYKAEKSVEESNPSPTPLRLLGNILCFDGMLSILDQQTRRYLSV
jgi:hypothetical protein